MNVVFLGVTDWIKQRLFGGLLEEVGWLMIGFKLVVLIFIVGFVRSRFGGGPLVTILTLGIGYIVFFQQWYIFGPMMFIYLFIIFGFSAVIMDIAITGGHKKSAWVSHGEMQGMGAMEEGEIETETGHRKMNEIREMNERRARTLGGLRGRF